MNQTNRLGHGVAGAGTICCGTVLVVALTEVTLASALAQLFIANAMSPFPPSEIRLMTATPAGADPCGQLRTRSLIDGYPVPGISAINLEVPDGMVLHLQQGNEAPLNLFLHNPGAADLLFFVMALG